MPTRQPRHEEQKAGLAGRHQARQPRLPRAVSSMPQVEERYPFSFSVEKARAGEGNRRRNKLEEETASHLLGQKAKQLFHGYTCGFKMSKQRATAPAGWEEGKNGAINTSRRREFLPT